MAQKLKEQNINVYIRVRPNTEQEKQPKYGTLFDIVSPKEILLKHCHAKKYNFDRIFDEMSTQNDIYTMIVRPLISEVIGGYNCTVFAYGQTGTGKTYTMTGGKADCEGIIPRAVSHIFDILGDLNTESSVKVSYIQLYNEELIDMLSTHEKPIRMYEDKNQKGSVILHGIEEVSVSNKNQVYKLLEMGNEKRKIAPTLMNVSSSRSHTVFTIIVHTRETTLTGEELVKTGKINLVDLAGSENISRSGSMDKRAREAGNINQSLLTLGRVIKAFTEKNTHIPYRESKLTRLLQDSLGGTTKTSLIATVSSSTANSEETLSTLDYAIRAKCIKNRPEVNQKISRTALLQQYLDEIDRLKKDLQAARTGNGIYLDEDNYKLLMEQNEMQRNELIGKMTAIRNLQITLEGKNHALEAIQSNWTAAVDNVELMKQEKIEREQELEEFKTKTKYLEKKNNVFYQNSETLHNKLSFLYQTADSNKKITRAFVDTYNELYNELMCCIDQSIVAIHNSFMEPLLTSRKELLEENYIAIRTYLENIRELSTRIGVYKTSYFAKSSIHSNILADCFDKLQRGTEISYHQMTNDISKIMEGLLPEFKNCIENISTSTRDEIQKVLLILQDIRTHSIFISKWVSDELTSLHCMLLESSQAILEKVEEQNKQLILNRRHISNIKESITTHFEELQGRLSKLDAGENLVLQKNNDIASTLKDIKIFVSNTSDSVQANIAEKIENSGSNLDKCSNILDTLQISGIKNKTQSFNQVEQGCKTKVHECMITIDDHLKTTTTNINNLHQECISQRTECDECFTHLVNTCEAVSSNVTNAMENLDECCSREEEQTKSFKEEMTNIQLKFDNSVKNKFKNMFDAVKNFCNSKLNHPSHTGDTPQRVSLRFSLGFEKENVTANTTNNSDIPAIELETIPEAPNHSSKRSRYINTFRKELWSKEN